MIILAEILIIFMIFYEYKQYHLAATPIGILGGIYFLFIPMINTIGVFLGFLKLEDKTIILFTLFLLILLICGQFWLVVLGRCSNRRISNNYIKEKLFYKEKFIWQAYIVSLACYVVSLLQVIQRYGIDNTKSKAYGPFAHVGFLSRCLLPVILYYFIENKKLKYLIAAVINVVALIMFKGKYHLYIPIAGFVVLFLTTKKNIRISKILKIAAITFLAAIILFVSVYTVIPNILAGETTWLDMRDGLRFSFRHFFHYLFCPFIASNEYFDNPAYLGFDSGIRNNFSPFDTLYQWLSGQGNYNDPVITLWPVVEESGLTANVGGIFSESVLNIGYIPAILYVFLIGSIVYYFFINMIYNGKRIITSVYLLGMFMVCFFCNYFTLFPNLECFVYCYFMDVVLLDNTYIIGRRVLFQGTNK